MAARYAIYAAPPAGSKLARIGADLLGYDADAAAVRAQMVPDGFDGAEWHELTEDPRRYGFHGTLKAPFHLRDGAALADFEAALEEFAGRNAPLPVPLKLEAIGSFLALIPAGPAEGLNAFAADVVRHFEPFRQPLSVADRERRLKGGLSPRQVELLDAYGYPYVLEQFRYHMTLTGRLPAERMAAARAGLEPLVAAAIAEPFLLDALVLFEQPSRDGNFRIRARFPLAT